MYRDLPAAVASSFSIAANASVSGAASVHPQSHHEADAAAAEDIARPSTSKSTLDATVEDFLTTKQTYTNRSVKRLRRVKRLLERLVDSLARSHLSPAQQTDRLARYTTYVHSILAVCRDTDSGQPLSEELDRALGEFLVHLQLLHYELPGTNAIDSIQQRRQLADTLALLSEGRRAVFQSLCDCLRAHSCRQTSALSPELARHANTGSAKVALRAYEGCIRASKRLGKQLSATMHAKLFALLTGALSPQDILPYTANLDSLAWTRLPLDQVDKLWRRLVDNGGEANLSAFAHVVGSKTIRTNSAVQLQPTIRVRVLHRRLFQANFTRLSWSPARSGAENLGGNAITRALGHFLSAFVLAAEAELGNNSIVNKVASDRVVTLTKMLKRQEQLALPVQSISALLHYTGICSRTTLWHLHRAGVLTLAWASLRPHLDAESESHADIAMLRAFLNAIPEAKAYGANLVLPPRATEWEHLSEENKAWWREALDIALAWTQGHGDLDMIEAPPARTGRRSAEQIQKCTTEATAELEALNTSRFIQDVAKAALRLSDPDTVLALVQDSRLVPLHQLIVLSELVRYVRERRVPLDTQQRSQLMGRVSHLSESLATRLADQGGAHLSPDQLHHLSSLVSALFYFQHYSSGGRLLLTLQNPSLLPPGDIREFLYLLSYNQRPRLAQALYERLSPATLRVRHYEAVLSSPDDELSNRAWGDILAAARCQLSEHDSSGGDRNLYGTKIGNKDTRHYFNDVRLLNARLKHYANNGGQRVSSRALLVDHANAINVLGIEPTSKTDHLLFVTLLKAGRFRRAYEMYERIKSAALGDHVEYLPHLVAVAAHRRLGSRGYGPVSALNRFTKTIAKFKEDGLVIDSKISNIILRSHLQWAEVDSEGIWEAYRSGLGNTDERDWHSDLKPFFKMIIRAFLRRGNQEDAKKVVVDMARVRETKIGR